MIIDDHITGIDAYAELYPAIGVDPGIPIGKFLLHVEPAMYRVYGAVKLGQNPIAEAADQSAAVFADFRLDYTFYIICKLDVCAPFVDTHQSAIADDIGNQHGRQPAFQVCAFHTDHLIFR